MGKVDWEDAVVVDEVTQEVADRISDEQAKEPQLEDFTAPLPKKGHLKLQCSCGHECNISEDIIEDGLGWTMLYDNDHYLLLVCPKCGHSMKMFLQELKDELPQESNTE
jgi:hypothetical protein